MGMLGRTLVTTVSVTLLGCGQFGAASKPTPQLGSARIQADMPPGGSMGGSAPSTPRRRGGRRGGEGVRIQLPGEYSRVYIPTTTPIEFKEISCRQLEQGCIRRSEAAGYWFPRWHCSSVYENCMRSGEGAGESTGSPF